MSIQWKSMGSKTTSHHMYSQFTDKSIFRNILFLSSAGLYTLYKRPKSPVNVFSKGSQGQQNPFSDVLVTCSLTTNPISHMTLYQYLKWETINTRGHYVDSRNWSMTTLPKQNLKSYIPQSKIGLRSVMETYL